MAERINTQVTITGVYSYERPAYVYGTETVHIYKMADDEGTIYVWKTTSFMTVSLETPKDGYFLGECVEKGDVVTIKATVKEESEYNGEPQTIVQRVKVVSREFRAERWDEKQARIEAENEAKKQAQMDSINEGDFIWRMPYKQYKEHYADCETIIGSYAQPKHYRDIATIEVIIRAGRLKASGVRGEHYSGYELINEDGKKVCYRAVNEENAIKRAMKEIPSESWECCKIYRY